MKNNAPFFGIIIGAFGLMKQKYRAVIFAVITFAMISGVFSAFAQRHIDTIETILASELKVSRDELDTLVVKDLERISSLGMNDLKLELQYRGAPFVLLDAVQKSEKNIGLIYISRVAPYITLLALLNCIIIFVTYVYFLVLFSRGNISSYQAATALPKAVISQIVLSFLVGIRSFLWIPLLGPFFGLYFVPRLSLSPVILASGETGIVPSVKKSLERTSGKWLTVVLRTLGVLLIMTLCLWPALVLTAAIGLFSLKLSYIAWLAAVLTLVAFYSAAKTMLAAMLA